MEEPKYEFELLSDNMFTGNDPRILGYESLHGLSWTWKFATDYTASDKSQRHVYLSWDFGWQMLAEQGIEGFEGTITPSFKGRDRLWHSTPFKVKLENPTGESVEKRIDTEEKVSFETNYRCIKYSLKLRPIRVAEQVMEQLEKNFEPSVMTDTVLVVEERRMHVNKSFLSFHSEFFRTLFTADFKEKNLNEIPINDVKYSEFARLLSVVLPNPMFATDASCESLLELADRFIFLSVTRHVEHHLLIDSKLQNYVSIQFVEKLLELSERFNLPSVREDVVKRLLNDSGLRFCPVWRLAEKWNILEIKERIIDWIAENEHMVRIRENELYEELSDGVKVKLFERMVEINKKKEDVGRQHFHSGRCPFDSDSDEDDEL